MPLLERLAQRVPASSLAVVRFAFGIALVWEAVYYLRRVGSHLVGPTFHFTYPLAPWVAPAPLPWMAAALGAMGVCGALVALGIGTRVAAPAAATVLAWVFLIDQALYLNHTYLAVLLGLLLAVVPTDRALSLRAALRRRGLPAAGASTGAGAGAEDGASVPAWALLAVRFQIGLPYVLGGVAKISPDWLRGVPMTAWLSASDDAPVIGALARVPGAGIGFAWAGLLLDLLVVPALLWRRTRVAAFVAVIAFHVLNARLFTIGAFPWLMIGATTVFLPPDWPTRLLLDARRAPLARGLPVLLGAAAVALAARWIVGPIGALPVAATALAGAWLGHRAGAAADGRSAGERAPLAPEAAAAAGGLRLPRAGAVLLAALALVQIVLPFRHLAYPGRAAWTEEGHRFAWRMMLRVKSGDASFVVRDPATGREDVFDPRGALEPWQYRQMVESPRMIQDFARDIASRMAAIGYPGVEVRARTEVSLNFRERRPLVDPEVDLASAPAGLGHAPWIEPLDAPLPARVDDAAGASGAPDGPE